MTFTERPPGNGRPLAVVARALAGGAATALLLAACSTGSQSLSDSNTLSPLDTAASTTGPATTAAPPPTVSPTTVVTRTTPPIPTITVPAIPSTILATVVPPPTTAAPTTVPPPTAPSPPTAASTTAPSGPSSSGCAACSPDFEFPYATHFRVPQLGTEPVRGTGCGADGSLGETIPDGIWNGNIEVSGSSLTIDVQCVYFGSSARPFVAACDQGSGPDGCDELDPDFWIVNNNPRRRTVPLDPGFRRRFENRDCADPGPGQGMTEPDAAASFDSWLIIEDGRAAFALTSCVYG